MPISIRDCAWSKTSVVAQTVEIVAKSRAHHFAVDDPIDDKVSNVHTFRTIGARQRLSEHTKTRFHHREMGEIRFAAHRAGSAREEKAARALGFQDWDCTLGCEKGALYGGRIVLNDVCKFSF